MNELVSCCIISGPCFFLFFCCGGRVQKERPFTCLWWSFFSAVRMHDYQMDPKPSQTYKRQPLTESVHTRKMFLSFYVCVSQKLQGINGNMILPWYMQYKHSDSKAMLLLAYSYSSYYLRAFREVNKIFHCMVNSSWCLQEIAAVCYFYWIVTKPFTNSSITVVTDCTSY